MIMLRSFGLLGTLRLSLKEHLITEATPTECFVDLRLTHPWPELSSFASDFELDSLDSVSFQRVPYIVLLLQAASNWRSEHDGMLPKSNDEQAEFKRVLSAMRRTHDEDNFQEALNAVRHICKPPSLSPNVVELLEALASKSLAQSTSSFWFKIYQVITMWTPTHQFHNFPFLLNYHPPLLKIKARNLERLCFFTRSKRMCATQ